MRGAVQDFLAPEIRDMRAIRDRLEDQPSTHRDVQTLKEQMAELRARPQPSA
jgi:hypothetical protein